MFEQNNDCMTEAADQWRGCLSRGSTRQKQIQRQTYNLFESENTDRIFPGAPPEKVALPISDWPTRKSFLLSLAGKAVRSFDSEVFSLRYCK